MDDKIKLEELKILEETYRNAVPQLKFDSPFELLVAVILSAQCTDKRVNLVTAELFPLANTPEKILQLGEARLEEIIKPCGLSRSKQNISSRLQKFYRRITAAKFLPISTS